MSYEIQRVLTPYLVKLQQLLKNNARRHFLEWKFSTRIYWNTWKLPKRNLLFQLPKVLIIFVISGVRPGENMVCMGRIININSHYQNFYCVCCVVSSCFPISGTETFIFHHVSLRQTVNCVETRLEMFTLELDYVRYKFKCCWPNVCEPIPLTFACLEAELYWPKGRVKNRLVSEHRK